MTKYIYEFGPENTEGNAAMKTLRGGKGANLAEMARMGLPVPPGFTISTACCNGYFDSGGPGRARRRHGHPAYPRDDDDE